MFKLKPPDRLDRPSFWAWAVPLMLGHTLLTFMTVAGAHGIGAIDTLVVIFYAMVLGSRFRDIGWPAWIAPTFVIATMVVIPIVGVGIAIASNVRPAEFMSWITSIGVIVGPANLLLMVIAGSIPGREHNDPPPATLAASGGSGSRPPEGPEAYDAPTLQGASPASIISNAAPELEGKFSGRDALVVGGGAVAIVAILVAASSGWLTPPKQQPPVTQYVSFPSPPPQTSSAGAQQVPSRAQQQMQVETNGLTKYTNDFLRQLQQSSPNRR